MNDPTYKVWAIERVLRIAESEDERRKNLEAKATLGTTLTVGVLGGVASITSPPPLAWSIEWILYAVAYFAACATFVCAYHTIKPRATFEVDPKQFLDDDVLSLSPEERLDEIIDHLKSVLPEVEKFANEKGRLADMGQQWALVGSVAFLAALCKSVLMASTVPVD